MAKPQNSQFKFLEKYTEDIYQRMKMRLGENIKNSEIVKEMYKMLDLYTCVKTPR